MEVEVKQRHRADVPTPSAQSRRIGRSRSESSRGRAQPHSALVCTTRSPRAPHFIYLSHVSRDSAISTPPFVSFRFACPDPPACVPTAPDHSGRRAHAPSTLSRADHRAPWPNAVYTTAFVEPFHRTRRFASSRSTGHISWGTNNSQGLAILIIYRWWWVQSQHNIHILFTMNHPRYNF